MEIRYLKMIKAIAEEGSIAGAIDTFFLTQPAFSHQLKAAEQQEGAKVLLRHKKHPDCFNHFIECLQTEIKYHGLSHKNSRTQGSALSY